jgi:hypothetical protein
MWNVAKSVHVILICTILFLGHLHSSTVFPPEETEELELQIYETYDSQESDSASLSEDDIVLIGTVLVIVAVPIAPAAGFLYVWANSLAADQPESGTRNSYTADDASAMTDSGDDNALISVRWQHAEDNLNWAFVVIKLSVGDNTYDCSTDGSEECSIGQDGDDDAVWETGEFLILSESGTDIADGATNIDMYVTYRGTAVAGTDDVTVS